MKEAILNLSSDIVFLLPCFCGSFVYYCVKDGPTSSQRWKFRSFMNWKLMFEMKPLKENFSNSRIHRLSRSPKLTCLLTGMCLLFVIYVVCLTWLRAKPKTIIYESPALMAEFPQSEMACDKNPNVMYPSNTDSYSVILGLRSPGFLAAITNHLQQGYGVVAVSTQTDNLVASYADLQPVLKRNPKFVLISSASKCSSENLGGLFDKYVIEKITIMYDTTDFVPYISARDTSASVSCLVSLLEIVAHHDRGKYNKIPIRVHHAPEKVPSFIPFYHKAQQKPDPYFILKHAKTDIERCDTSFHYQQYYDVFLKSVEIYATTYKRLYDLNVRRIVS